MMDARRLINEYLDGRLAPAQRTRFERQLAADPALTAELRATQEALALLRALPVEAAPAGLTDRIMRDVRTQPVPVRRPLRDWLTRLVSPGRLALAGAVGAVALALVALGQPSAPADPVRLSSADEQFVGDCLVDYHLAASDRLRQASHKPRSESQRDASAEF